MKVTFMPTQYELLKDFTVNRADYMKLKLLFCLLNLSSLIIYNRSTIYKMKLLSNMPSPFRCNLFLSGGLKPKLLYLVTIEFHVDFAPRKHMALTHVIFCREKTPKMHRCKYGSYPNYKILKTNQEINKRTSPNRVELI